jgi:hypothetical protein
VRLLESMAVEGRRAGRCVYIRVLSGNSISQAWWVVKKISKNQLERCCLRGVGWLGSLAVQCFFPDQVEGLSRGAKSRFWFSCTGGVVGHDGVGGSSGEWCGLQVEGIGVLYGQVLLVVSRIRAAELAGVDLAGGRGVKGAVSASPVRGVR